MGIILQQAKEYDDLKETFSSVSQTMWILALQGCLLDDLVDMMNDIVNASKVLAGVFALFIILANFVLLNMLIGLLAEVVSQAGTEDEEEMKIKSLRHRMEEILECHDTEDDERLDLAEFSLMMKNPTMQQTLDEFGISPDLVKAFVEDLLMRPKPEPSTIAVPVEGLDDDKDDDETGRKGMGVSHRDGTITFDAFLDVLADMFGNNGASVKDIVELRREVVSGFEKAMAPETRGEGESGDKMDQILSILQSRNEKLAELQGELRQMKSKLPG